MDSINGDATIHNKLSVLVKKTCQKVQQIKECILVGQEKCTLCSRKKLTEFYSEWHQYTISLYFKLNCVKLFDSELCDVHQSVCYNIFEEIRKFNIQEQATTFQAEIGRVYSASAPAYPRWGWGDTLTIGTLYSMFLLNHVTCASYWSCQCKQLNDTFLT